MVTSFGHRLLITAEAADRLGITVGELAAFHKSGTGPDWIKLGRTVRYIADDLDWWLEQTNPTAKPGQ